MGKNDPAAGTVPVANTPVEKAAMDKALMDKAVEKAGEKLDKAYSEAESKAGPVHNTVKMTRTPEAAAGGPTEADVHPDEVENFKKDGWTNGK